MVRGGAESEKGFKRYTFTLPADEAVEVKGVIVKHHVTEQRGLRILIAGGIEVLKASDEGRKVEVTEQDGTVTNYKFIH